VLIGPDDFRRGNAAVSFQGMIPVEDPMILSDDEGGYRRSMQDVLESLLPLF